MSTTVLGANTRRNIDTHYFISLQLKELEDAWGALPGEPAVPTRLLRSQQQSQAAAVPVGGGGGGGGSEASGGGAPMAAEPVDPYEFLDPVDLLEQMPKNFYEQLVMCVCVCV